jgi:primosomal protein N' (replication factor Y) (superfamily II helicase)
VLRVALDTPLRQLFDYLPPGTPGNVDLGMRVRVPFGRQRIVGVTMEAATSSSVAIEKLKPIAEVLDESPVLDSSARALIAWAADYYHHPIGEVVAAALPKALREGAPALALVERWSLTPEGVAALSAGALTRAPKQRRLLELLAGHSGLDAASIAVEVPAWRDAARIAAMKGWIASSEEPLRESGASAEAGAASGVAPDLTPEQDIAVQAVGAAFGRYAPFLLHGVTGSGKTEVYLRLVQRALDAGRRALVLVPEIGLTPQLVARFRERLAVPFALLHSALTDQERLAAWRNAWSGRARVVVGTRSAVFAPVPDLGLIVIDEEHDASYKQHDSGFRYSARDLAVVRARQADVPVVLGSATPSVESLHNASTGRYTRLALPRRPGQAQPPRASLVDLRSNAMHAGLSTPAAQAMERHLADDGQVLVFLNRRGYAPTLLCTTCGWIAPCSECDAYLTVHQGANRLRCHHCGADVAIPRACKRCGFPVKPVGQGTERVEETLAKLFPGVAIVRLDRDTVRRRGDAEAVMQKMASGAARILVGTQMVTKGHDFPNVTLVVVLNADQGLFSTDFRAPERLAQTIVQVAGRAGRGDRPGEVLIQTDYPEHPFLRSLLAEGYEGFVRTALVEREQSRWPPFSRLAALRASATAADLAISFLDEARRAARAPGNVKLLGPAPAAMARRAGRYHAQLLIESPDRTALHRFVDEWLPEVEALKSARRARWALDVDPLELF